MQTVHSSLCETVERAKAGDVSAFTHLTKAYQNLVFGYAFGMLGDFHLAQDVTQETFLIAFSSFAKLSSPDALPTWLRRIAHHRCHRILRRRTLKSASLDLDFDVASIEPPPIGVIVHREEMSAVTQAIA
ncbi:MAG TPA: sigma-70 family RNA polymerase sigma factor, partial [Tepidisphaeraceae bacterium]|nr:sigma-70 family RNA polymerase sigma factor [Tepidisphaeraceae bacterium]